MKKPLNHNVECNKVHSYTHSGFYAANPKPSSWVLYG